MPNPSSSDERSFQRRQTVLELIGSAAADASFVALFQDALAGRPPAGVLDIVPYREDAGVPRVGQIRFL
jgi:hypothetical protein